MRSHSYFALLLLATVSADEHCPKISSQALDNAKLALTIEAALQQDYAPLDAAAPVLGLVYVGPSGSGPGSGGLRPVRDGVLPPVAGRPAQPSDALREPGSYVGTFTGKALQPRYLARLGAPGAVLGERAVDGELSAVLAKPDAVVFAGRIPFVGGDRVAVFDTREGELSEVRWSYTLEQRLQPRQLPRFEPAVIP